MKEPITEFKGKHFFLSNFYTPRQMPSGEHLFQAAKATTTGDYMKVMSAPTPGQAKSLGRLIKLRDDWEDVKDDIMADVIAFKFHEPHLRSLLLQTAGQELIEGNAWGDTYWGVDLRTGRGENMLGKTLMAHRHNLLG